MNAAPEQPGATGGGRHGGPLGRALRWLDRAEEVASVLLVSLVLVVVSAQVVMRYVFQAPFFWGDELARYSYVWMAFIAGAFVTGRRTHVRIDLLGKLLPARGLVLLECFANLVVTGTCFALVVFSFDWLMGTARPKSPALRMPMIWLYGGVWVSLALMSFHSLVTLIFVATGREPATPPDGEIYE